MRWAALAACVVLSVIWPFTQTEAAPEPERTVVVIPPDGDARGVTASRSYDRVSVEALPKPTPISTPVEPPPPEPVTPHTPAPEPPTQEAAASSGLPSLLLFIRSQESGGNYAAYNPGGCEGYGCGGAYQLHARYASVWAERAGYSGMSSSAQTWSPDVQDAVALDLFYSTNPDGAHWCNWTDYC